jgi:predicted CXXCH cytochrome family protein
MKILWLLTLIGAIAAGMAGCAASKTAGGNRSLDAGIIPAPSSCRECHQEQYATWAGSDHADTDRMKKIEPPEKRGCGACHDGLTAHLENPAGSTPPDLAAMSKTEQNNVCGACHYQKEVLGRKAIDPHHRHALLMSVGFEGFEHQIGCLDCHKGHIKRSEMLRSPRVHSCFRCHKEAVITMGVFQPFNYAAFGKVCVSCHPAHGGSAPSQLARMSVGLAVTCIICHPKGDLSQTGF